MTKAELRKIYLEKRKNLSAEERKQKSAQIAENFFQKFDLANVNFLHCFLPIERFNEIDTRLILDRIRREFPHVETVVPRVNSKTDELEHLLLKPETVLIKNSWQIEEPASDETIAPEKIDLVLAPLLCFDERGYRVGYGKGFYDKFLKKCRADCKKIGLSFFPPVENISDVNDFDVKLDFCIVPEGIFEVKTQKRGEI